MEPDGERQLRGMVGGEGAEGRGRGSLVSYQEGYEWLHGLLMGAGYDPSRDSPESFMGRMSAQSDRIAELERLLAARVEH
jgi:hypothetical protein